MATLGASRFRSHTRSKGPDDVDGDDTADISVERSKHALIFSTLGSLVVAFLGALTDELSKLARMPAR
jgi:hypothetical protein